MNLLGKILGVAVSSASLLEGGMEAALPHMDVDGTFFLVNRQYMITENYVPETVAADVSGSVRNMRPDAAAALEEMFAACKEEAKTSLVTVSGYRSYATQKTIYNRKLKKTGSEEKANEYVALPGASEHQLGLAMDLGQKSANTGLTSSFGNTKGGKWVKENAHRFGFILRYQEGWEEITGYKYEPWHVRYVGVEAATAMYENDQPMEYFIEDLRVSALITILEEGPAE